MYGSRTYDRVISSKRGKQRGWEESKEGSEGGKSEEEQARKKHMKKEANVKAEAKG